MFIIFFFFFSSRRRHTRFSRDWSSDVCSSDLGLVQDAGLRPRAGRSEPRIHDLRHTFAVRPLIDWYRAGIDVQMRMPRLSSYLGHAAPSGTYWYLQAVPELLALAAGRLELEQD